MQLKGGKQSAVEVAVQVPLDVTQGTGASTEPDP
jgi:hypothetical protein